MRFNPAFLSVAVLLAAAGCNPGPPAGDQSAQNHLKKLVIKDTVAGKGAPVETGDEVWVVYTGKLMNGHVFDTNDKKDGVPFHVTVGANEVIKGWDQGLVGMKLGGKRHLDIPYSLAYGAAKKGDDIPAFSDLQFDIQLKQLLRKADTETINANDVKKGAGEQAKVGDTVTISYDAKVKGEKTYESQPKMTFTIGGDDVKIPGFDKALVGMRVGGVRTVEIPPALTRALGIEDLGMNIGVWTVTLKSVTHKSASAP